MRLAAATLFSLPPRGTSGGRVGESLFCEVVPCPEPVEGPPLPGPLLHGMEERETRLIIDQVSAAPAPWPAIHTAQASCRAERTRGLIGAADAATESPALRSRASP